PPVEERRDGRALDRRGLLVAEGREGLAELAREAEPGEAFARGRRLEGESGCGVRLAGGAGGRGRGRFVHPLVIRAATRLADREKRPLAVCRTPAASVSAPA